MQPLLVHVPLDRDRFYQTVRILGVEEEQLQSCVWCRKTTGRVGGWTGQMVESTSIEITFNADDYPRKSYRCSALT